MFLGLVVDLRVVDAEEKSSKLQESKREFLDSLTLMWFSAMVTVSW